MQQTFRCPACGAQFPTQLALEEHVSREHQGTQLPPSQAKDPASSREFPSDESIEESREREGQKAG
ncbi:MAG: hypothetical protein E6J42_00470 [Chloroflexi bacterium]|nr:MAG: hypothetical protein E6J42_00470 [Chloroflexota bacterium]